MVRLIMDKGDKLEFAQLYLYENKNAITSLLQLKIEQKKI